MSITQQKIGYKDKMYRVAVDLEKVIEVNPEEMTVTVEPSVSIGFLNRFLVSKGSNYKKTQNPGKVSNLKHSATSQ